MIHFVSVSTFRRRFYPKWGPSQQLDIDDNEVTRLVEEFVQESNSGQIVVHDIHENLEIIEE